MNEHVIQFHLLILFLVCFLGPSEAILCFNGTFTSAVFGDDPLSRWKFLHNKRDIIRARCRFSISCEENASCFVRSWATRSRHSWLVQRGCYYASPGDPLPRALERPRRQMTCLRERLADAEYNVCLCTTDLCNSVSQLLRHQYCYVTVAIILAVLI